MPTGYRYEDPEPKQACPYCNMLCDADFVDIGVGFQQCGPYYCQNCGASEIGPYDDERALTEDEKRTGWYGPNSEPGSSANVIGNKVVSHKTMLQAYREEFTNNPRYAVPGAVRAWFKKVRKEGIPE